MTAKRAITTSAVWAYEDCIALIRAKGYKVKGETFGENAYKFISFRPLDREHFVRGSAKSLGTEYIKERIQERIAEKTLNIAAASYSQAGSIAELEKQ